MSSFCVIGSGISGATIANLLNKKHTVDLYDKARGLGGRSSFKRLDNLRGFDHGTQYFSPKTTEFKRFTKKLIEKKILKIWGGNHKFLSDKKKENKKHAKDIGRKGNNDISKYLLKNVKPGSYQVKASYIGYQAVEVDIELTSSENITQDFELSYVSLQGEAIEVTAQARGQILSLIHI